LFLVVAGPPLILASSQLPSVRVRGHFSKLECGTASRRV
jgi:hypothetical protein